MTRKKTILFVAMQMSTHTARWINQLSGAGWDIHLFPVNHMAVHPALRDITIHQPFWVVRPRDAVLRVAGRLFRKLTGRPSLRTGNLDAVGNRIRAVYPVPVLSRWVPYLNALSRVRLGESDQTAPAIFGPRVLARLVSRLKPDLVHSLEFQHCGYLTLAAKDRSGPGFPKWMATNWGSDIYHYRTHEPHRQQISRLLRSVDFYSCECERDVGLARELGLTAPVMPVMPNTGGFDLQVVGTLRDFAPASVRRIIMVKGYQHFAGRALTALEALERCIPELAGYCIVVYSPSHEVLQRVRDLREYLGVDIKVLPHTSHEHMLQMFSRARIYLGISVSDAISTSLLEAMATGAFPIQTNTSCCNEWIKDGISGFEVPADNSAVIADRIRRALADNELVDRAAAVNWEMVQERLDERVLREKAQQIYRSVLESDRRVRAS